MLASSVVRFLLENGDEVGLEQYMDSDFDMLVARDVTAGRELWKKLELTGARAVLKREGYSDEDVAHAVLARSLAKNESPK